MSTTSTGVNVLRYSALALGVFYGMYHQTAITSRAKSAQDERAYSNQESLIAQAKAAYLKSRLPVEKKSESGNVVTDPMDPRFDLEAYLTVKTAEEAK
ncbi:MAG: hypothetical protein M1816_007523 [Peltula sp. TS41687]|nr:MAG: hypothetical protein M1816_007523 [Peltula sp. TS41687]